MKEISIIDLRELQMQILDYVDSFCRENGIRYSLSGGSLLGAIRHKGFIPWDDDIDIQMLRDDYDRFISCWKRSTHPFILHDISLGNCNFVYGKVSNPRTSSRDGNRWLMGVNIDVFPIDKVVDMDDFSFRHERILKQYKYLERITRSFSFNPKTLFWKFIGVFMSEKATLMRMHRIAVQQNAAPSKYVFEMVAGRLNKRPFPRAIFDKMVDVPFENRKYMAFQDFDTYLQSCFGDYMKLPPEEERVSHHAFKAYWK